MESTQDRTIGLSTESQNTVQVFKMSVKPKLVGGVISERYFGLAHFTSGTWMAYAVFDLESGSKFASGGDHLHSYIRYMHEATEPGWYEVGLAYDSDVAPGTAQVGFFLTDNALNVSTSGAIGDGVYIAWANVRPLGAIGGAASYTGPYTYGKYVPRVTAVVDGLGDASADLCFNSFFTCQDTANYLKEVRTLKFIDSLQRPQQFLDYYPAILSARYTPTVLKPGGNLSLRGKVTITLQDYATTDNEIDDYAHLRGYNSEDQGTFFGKLKARHRYYIGRPMRVKEGYLDNASITDFRTREYIIDDISGPTADGKVTIVGKDILSLAADVRAKAPTATTGTLASSLTAIATTATVSTGDGAQYPAGEHIRINDEIILINTRSGDSLTSISRGQGGTTAVAHNSGDAIQLCLTYTDEPIIDVVDDLLTTYAGVPASFIPTTDWEAEETESLSGYLMTTIISEPTGVLTLLKELVEITLLDIWYDDVAQEIKLKLQTPFTEVTETVNDQEDILENSLVVKDLNAQRLTRVLIYYGIRNYARDLKETENYSLVNFEIEADKEGVNKYNDERIKVIFSRWFDSSNATQVALTSQRLLDRFGITPKGIQFKLDAKDVERLTTGDVFDLSSRIEQDLDGSPATNRYQVVETKATKPGSEYLYRAEAFFQDPTPDSLTIAANEFDYDVFVELGGPPGPVDITLTINAGIDVEGLTGPAITTAGLHPDSTLRIVNNGEIKGTGGNGGAGAGVSGFWEFEPGLGCIGIANSPNGGGGINGGDAINNVAGIDLTIDNTNGNIFGGAGGGGGGGADEGYPIFGGGGGGGGGRGTDTATGGALGLSNVTGQGVCSVTNIDGTAGGGGTESVGGSGGTGGSSAGDGGAGGSDWGTAGTAGQNGIGSNGGSGGAAGYAVRLNGGSIVWEGGNTAAKVKGPVA
jgi:hypothetical protein